MNKQVGDQMEISEVRMCGRSNRYMPVMSDLVGRVFTSVMSDGDNLTFSNENEYFELHHDQACCENVYIEDICGDLRDLEDTPIIVTEERDKRSGICYLSR